MRYPLKISLATLVMTVAGTTHAQAQMRFQAMDSNHDGVITRQEWRGADSAFRHQDWNGDGILSGDEVRTGARRQTGWNQDWNRDGIIDNQDTLIAQRFRGYDANGDSRVAAAEWPGNQVLFGRLDVNRDGYLTMTEYTDTGGFKSDGQGGPAFTFASLDRNRDGWIARNEWNMGTVEFNRLDTNRDSRISNFEFQNSSVNDNNSNNIVDDQGFVNADRNRDGWVTRAESGMSNAEFNQLDTNSDNRLSRYEFAAMAIDTGNSQFMNAPFQGIDNDRDGWLTRREWQWDAASFNRVDTNNDGRISRFEFEAAAGQGVTNDRVTDDRVASDRFMTADRNRDGYVARAEWSWAPAWFDRIDTSRDNRISRAEYDAASQYFNERANRYDDNSYIGNPPQTERTRTFQSGFDRGLEEGRRAGHEDDVNGHGWDLEGQTELERADSGYYSQMGSLSEYQNGYREGFRQAYREGFNSR